MKQQHVVVMGIDETCDARDAIGPGTVLDDYGLSPSPGESLGKQARREIGGTAARKRQDDSDGTLRPRFRVTRLGSAHDYCDEQRGKSNSGLGRMACPRFRSR